MDPTRKVIRSMLTERLLTVAEVDAYAKKAWKELTEQVAAIMAKAPVDEDSGPVEQGVSVYVDSVHQRMRVDVGDWFGNYEWFEEQLVESFPKFIEIEVTDEAGSPSWEHKKVFP